MWRCKSEGAWTGVGVNCDEQEGLSVLRDMTRRGNGEKDENESRQQLTCNRWPVIQISEFSPSACIFTSSGSVTSTLLMVKHSDFEE